MCSEESKDGGKGTDIVRGGLRFWGGKVDVAAVVGDKNVFVSATRFQGQLTGEVRSHGTQYGCKGGSLRRWGQGCPRVRAWMNEEKRVRGRVGGVGF